MLKKMLGIIIWDGSFEGLVRIIVLAVASGIVVFDLALTTFVLIR